MPNRVQLRRGTAATWTSTNPILAAGEPGVETDTGFLKVGNGTSTWTALPYTVGSAAGATLLDHLADVSGSIPATGEVALMYNRTTSQWEPTQLRSRSAWRQRVPQADFTQSGTNLNNAYPTKGGRMFMNTDALCTGVFARVNAGANQSFKLTLARLTGPSSSVTSDFTLAAILNEQTVTAGSSAGAQEIFSSFAGVTLSAGQAYVILVTDTSGATVTVYNSTGGYLGASMFTSYLSASHAVMYSTTDPNVGDVLGLTHGTNSYATEVGAILELPLSA